MFPLEDGLANVAVVDRVDAELELVICLLDAGAGGRHGGFVESLCWISVGLRIV